MTAQKIEKARVHFKKVDPLLFKIVQRVDRELIKTGKSKPFRPRKQGTLFEHTLHSIVFQQLSVKAATTIHGRVCALFEKNKPTPELLLAADETLLRSAGLSRQKISYLKDLAQHFASGKINLTTVEKLPDLELIETLTQVKGIGVWTVQMLLIFRLGRHDVLPTLDLGIQKGIQRTYALRSLPKPKRVAAIGTKWSPYCSVASWYLWRSLELSEI